MSNNGGYFAHLSIDYLLAYIASVGPVMVTGHGRLSFFESRQSRPFLYNLCTSITFYCMNYLNVYATEFLCYPQSKHAVALRVNNDIT